MKKVAIIGGGATGLLCAIKLKQQLGDRIDVTIFERNSRVGKKIAASGNGRGNLTNLNVAPQYYNNQMFVTHTLMKYSANALRQYFLKLGLLTYSDEEGRVYPYTDQASNVVDVLRLKLTSLGVKTKEVYVEDIKPNNGGFDIGKDHFDYAVLAIGSIANNKEKVNKLQKKIQKMGHSFSPFAPSLTPLPCKNKYLPSLKGIRVRAKATLFIEGTKIHGEQGEVLFKEKALSGIAVFNLSSYLGRCIVQGIKPQAKVYLDFFSDFELDELVSLLDSQGKIKDAKQAEESLKGFLNKMISKMVIETMKAKKIAMNTENLAKMLKNFEFVVDVPTDTSYAQVMCGGVNVNEINYDKLESKIIPSLFMGGEMLNIDGVCGGFNLHFAFASGLKIADSIIAKEM